MKPRATAVAAAVVLATQVAGILAQAPDFSGTWKLDPARSRVEPTATLAGLDKFFNLLTDWGTYVSPLVAAVLPLSTDTLMAIVGVIEFAVGVSILTASRVATLTAAGTDLKTNCGWCICARTATPPLTSSAKIAPTMNANVTGALNVFEAVRLRAPKATLISVGSSAEYGGTNEQVPSLEEDAPLHLGQELHGRLSVMADHLVKLGRGLGAAADSYNAAIASFESRVLVSARKFKDLGATSQDAEIIELRAVEGGLRRRLRPCGAGVLDW